MMARLKRTPLFPVYEKHNARIVDFAGWELPIQFSGIKDEHLAVRKGAGIFDVSHMGEIFVRGPGALSFLQHAACNDASRLELGRAQYSAILNESGGIIDDVFIYRTGDAEYLICVNASNVEKDFEWLLSLPHDDCTIENESGDWAQVAVQGPDARTIVEAVSGPEVNDVKRPGIASVIIDSVEVLAARTGYTGEDGFELFIPVERAIEVWESLMDAGHGKLTPCGLGARDTLRLEMGYPLHGHDITPETTPLEADLEWIVALDKNDFVGKTALEKQKSEGIKKKRVGLVMEESGVARDGHKIIAPHGEGRVTSGTKTPCVKKAIAMGYVPVEDSDDGIMIEIDIRGKRKKARIKKWPFYKQ